MKPDNDDIVDVARRHGDVGGDGTCSVARRPIAYARSTAGTRRGSQSKVASRSLSTSLGTASRPH